MLAVPVLDDVDESVVVSALGLGCAEEEVGHPYLSALDVRRRIKRLALEEHVVERVEVLVIDLFIVLVEVDHPVSSLPRHFSASLSARTSDLSAQLVTLAPGGCAERFRGRVGGRRWSTADTSFGHGEGE